MLLWRQEYSFGIISSEPDVFIILFLLAVLIPDKIFGPSNSPMSFHTDRVSGGKKFSPATVPEIL